MTMESILSIAVGIGLSAACGFRVFLPLLLAGVAARWGHFELGGGFAWMGSWPALVAFGTATVVEVVAYYVPWLDHLLDTVAAPAAVAAGVAISASQFVEFDPLWRWSLAIIAGGGVAGLVKGTTMVTRTASTATTGGLGNPLVATLELGASLVTSLLAFLAPLLALGALVVAAGLLVGWWARRRRRRIAGVRAGG